MLKHEFSTSQHFRTDLVPRQLETNSYVTITHSHSFHDSVHFFTLSDRPINRSSIAYTSLAEVESLYNSAVEADIVNYEYSRNYYDIYVIC